MDKITDFFKESHESFTIYVVEQRFVIGRGNDYFKSFKGKENLILSNSSIKKRIYSIVKWLQKKVPHVAELVKACCDINPVISIADIITALSKLFSVHEHQAVGPEVLDPILIQEEKIDKKYLTQLIVLHKASILQPVIVIMLKDNDFERAKALLAHCPHGMNAKMIRNNGQTEIFKIVNKGVDDIDSFVDAYSRQCFSTCSRTPRSILLNEEWSEDSIVRKYSPLVFKVRSNLLYDEKIETQDDITLLRNQINADISFVTKDKEKRLLRTFDCIINLFKVYCNDKGGDEIQNALNLARELDNDILLAHVYRYSQFLGQYNRKEKRGLLLKAKELFSTNNIEDHAIYCLNNYLVHDFYTNSIDIRSFRNMQEEAVFNVPGLVGMSIIYNNTGVAHLYKGDPDEALRYFIKGLDYVQDRIVQKLGLMGNILIAKDYSFIKIEEGEIRKVLNYIFDNCGTERFPFIMAGIVMNILVITLKQYPAIIKEFMKIYPIEKLILNALRPGQLGSGSLALQIAVVQEKYKKFKINIGNPKELLQAASGIRLTFLHRNCYSPTIFNAWL